MLELLLKYQEIDSKLKTIEDEFNGSEEYKKYTQANNFLKKAKVNLSAFEDRSASMLNSFEDKQTQFKKLCDEKQELVENLNEGADEKELAYFKRRTQELSNQLAGLENDIKKLSDEINDLVKKYTNFAQQTKVAKKQNDEFKLKLEELSQSKAQEKSKIVSQLAELEKKIDPTAMQKYKEKRKDGRFPIVCKVEDNFCTACRTQLVLAEMEKLKNNKVIECSNCHCLIYLDE